MIKNLKRMVRDERGMATIGIVGAVTGIISMVVVAPICGLITCLITLLQPTPQGPSILKQLLGR